MITEPFSPDSSLRGRCAHFKLHMRQHKGVWPKISGRERCVHRTLTNLPQFPQAWRRTIDRAPHLPRLPLRPDFRSWASLNSDSPARGVWSSTRAHDLKAAAPAQSHRRQLMRSAALRAMLWVPNRSWKTSNQSTVGTSSRCHFSSCGICDLASRQPPDIAAKLGDQEGGENRERKDNAQVRPSHQADRS
jgi:hypothetical protein